MKKAAEPPKYLSSFIGRDKELAETEALLGRCRLLTITGPGGAGKTRLSIELAARVGDRFPDGVVHISLAELRDPAQTPAVLARSLGLPTAAPDQIPKQLREALGSRCALLVLDNFEQILDGAGIVGEILAASPRIRAIATSRSPLGLAGEQEYPLGPLCPPGSDAVSPESLRENPAVVLFVDRARAVRHDFRLELGNAASVARLCQGLDGMPLAIELAAARIRLFSPKAMADRLSRRFELLGGGARDLPERQRTLRRTIQWSYELLSAPAQRLFRGLCVCEGGMTMAAAEALCEAPADSELAAVDMLASLADHSILQRQDCPHGEARFTMLDSIRAFGMELLQSEGERARARELHARYFLGFAEQAKPHLTGVEQAVWFDRLDADHANFRAALKWAGSADGEPLLGIRAGAALWRHWLVRGRLYEGRPLLEGLLAKPSDNQPVEPRIDALHAIGSLCHYQGEMLVARRTLSECVELARQAGDNGRLAQALCGLAWVDCLTSNLDDCRRRSEDARLLFEQEGDLRGAAVTFNNCGWAANYAGDYPTARNCHERSLELRRAVGDVRGEGYALANLAWSERIHGDLDRAWALLDQAEAKLAPIDDKVLSGWALIQRAQVQRERGRLPEAAGILVEALASWGAGGHRALLAWTHGVLGAVLLDWGEPERGRELLTEALRQWQELECPWAVGWVRYEQGRWMLGRQNQTAARLLGESLSIRARIGDERGAAEAVEALLECGADAIPAGTWVELHSFAAARRLALEAPAPPAVTKRLASLKTAREAELGAAKAAAAVEHGARLSAARAMELLAPVAVDTADP